MDSEAKVLLVNYADKVKLSARGYNRTLKLARTIADLQNENIFRSMIKRNRKIGNQQPSLTTVTFTKVRFSEVDSMHVVWHGEYVRYLEDGREAFGREFPGIGYLDFYRNGYTAPIVD